MTPSDPAAVRRVGAAATHSEWEASKLETFFDIDALYTRVRRHISESKAHLKPRDPVINTTSRWERFF